MASADRLIEVFNEAKTRPSVVDRDQFLAEACRDEPALKEQVLSLLQAHDGAGDFLKHTQFIPAVIPLTEKPGDRIGRYKLLEQIGEGGCGVVYMAEQEEPVRRRVALKVIKLGMDTKQVIARFEAERQALALMDHPNIAKVLDAGATDTGRPFFVMELVRGVRITDYCDQNNLSTNERLELFIQVCQAIQHAHQKGIIHRDIKPSNILVTQHDDAAVPKVIDFGIAKATIGHLTDKTLFTAFAQFMGTPAYMSPEQAQMSGLDIDTRADIYSLGVLLYELLTGSTPFDAKALLAAGMDEMRRKIREDEPAKPSTCLSTMLAMDLTTVARHRHTDAPKLMHLIRGDLDWLVMKCLEKDRARRYETANGLAVDIHRHLSNEPIEARPPSNLYRFQKLVRRNKLAFTAAGAVTAALVIGLGISTWMFFKEKHARQRAVTAEQKTRTEAVKSQQVADFLKEMLKGVGPSVALGRDTKMLKEILDQTAERIGKDLKDQPLVEAELRNTLGEVYRALGEFKKSEAMHREALALRRQLLGSEHPDVATSLDNLANVLCRQDDNKRAEALNLGRQALGMRRKLLGDHLDVALSLNRVARYHLCRIQGDRDGAHLAEAETLYREELVLRRKLSGNEHPLVAVALSDLSNVIRADAGKRAEAEALNREALAMFRKFFGNDHPDIADSLGNLANLLHSQGRLAEAETTRRENLAMRRKLLGNEHPSVAGSLKFLAGILEDQGRLAEAEELFRESLAMRRKLSVNNSAELNEALASLADVLRVQGKLAEAEALYREDLASQRKLFGDVHREVEHALASLARVLDQEGKLAEAEAVWREELAMERKLSGEEHPFVANSLRSLAQVLQDQGKHDEAETVGREALTLQRKLPADDPQLAAAIASLTSTLLAAQKFAEAEPLSRECLAIREKKLPDDWRTFNARSMLGNSLLGQKKFLEAEPLLLSGYEGMKQREDKIPATGKLRLKASLQRIVQLYEATGQSEKAAEWNKTLSEFETAGAQK